MRKELLYPSGYWSPELWSHCQQWLQSGFPLSWPQGLKTKPISRVTWPATSDFVTVLTKASGTFSNKDVDHCFHLSLTEQGHLLGAIYRLKVHPRKNNKVRRRKVVQTREGDRNNKSESESCVWSTSNSRWVSSGHKCPPTQKPSLSLAELNPPFRC